MERLEQLLFTNFDKDGVLRMSQDAELGVDPLDLFEADAEASLTVFDVTNEEILGYLDPGLSDDGSILSGVKILVSEEVISGGDFDSVLIRVENVYGWAWWYTVPV